MYIESSATQVLHAMQNDLSQKVYAANLISQDMTTEYNGTYAWPNITHDGESN